MNYCIALRWGWAKSDSLALLPLQKLLRRPKKDPEVGWGGAFSHINPLCLLCKWILTNFELKVFVKKYDCEWRGHFRDQKDAMQGMTQREGGLLILYCKRCTAWGTITPNKGTEDAQDNLQSTLPSSNSVDSWTMVWKRIVRGSICELQKDMQAGLTTSKRRHFNRCSANNESSEVAQGERSVTHLQKKNWEINFHRN